MPINQNEINQWNQGTSANKTENGWNTYTQRSQDLYPLNYFPPIHSYTTHSKMFINSPFLKAQVFPPILRKSREIRDLLGYPKRHTPHIPHIPTQTSQFQCDLFQFHEKNNIFIFWPRKIEIVCNWIFEQNFRFCITVPFVAK